MQQVFSIDIATIPRPNRLEINPRLKLAFDIFISPADGHDDIIQALLRKKSLKLDHCDIMGRTALHIASLHCHPAAAKLLLLKGAALEQPDSAGRTPLHAAAAAQHAFLHTALANPPDRKLRIVDIDRPPLPIVHFAVPALPSQKGSSLLDVLKEDSASRRRTGGFAPWGPADSTSDQARRPLPQTPPPPCLPPPSAPARKPCSRTKARRRGCTPSLAD